MIRYASTKASIEAAIGNLNATWLDRAKQRTAHFVKANAYVEGGVGWSEIKPAYMALQHNKCIFCEAPEYAPERGTYNLDVEHFRPKNTVQLWPRAGAARQYQFSTGGAGGAYYWLALDPTNYAVSCKECNSRYKSNFFPVAAARGNTGNSPQQLQSELPFLCYPLGDWDEDPESLITFDGTIAIPASDDPLKLRRAEVIIDFFELNDRLALQRERAQFIILFGRFLEEVLIGMGGNQAELIVAKMELPSAPHASCLRSFKRAWLANPVRGKKILNDCIALYFDSIG
ncbi:hypothetical protein N182_35815 [Sinorhizobium sp. GL2]|nr:hypothetical protein N182_35815 [Sinorhizobium sp. GL2]